jgi:hypothetical protein
MIDFPEFPENLFLGQSVQWEDDTSLAGHNIEHGVQGFVVARQTLLLGNSIENPSRWRVKMWLIRIMKVACQKRVYR